MKYYKTCKTERKCYNIKNDMLARQPTLEYITAYLKHYGGTEHSVTREKQKHVIYIINNPLLLPIKSMCLCPYDM